MCLLICTLESLVCILERSVFVTSLEPGVSWPIPGHFLDKGVFASGKEPFFEKLGIETEKSQVSLDLCFYESAGKDGYNIQGSSMRTDLFQTIAEKYLGTGECSCSTVEFT